jgi:uncharacterized protein DUF3616
VPTFSAAALPVALPAKDAEMNNKLPFVYWLLVLLGSGMAPTWHAAAQNTAARNAVSDLQLRIGMCDASAAVALGTDRFIVANDEDQVLRVFRRGPGQEPLQGFDMSGFLFPDQSKPETDIEGATSVGNRIYWITSHGRNKNAVLRSSRYRFWATDWETKGDRIALNFAGDPYTRLLDDIFGHPALARYDLRSASERAPKSPGGLNIEALAATPEGKLLIGFRNPIPAGKAIILPVENPIEILKGSRAVLGTPIEIDLGGLGVRGMEYMPSNNRYVIIGGDYDKARPSQLFTWTGQSTDAPQVVPHVSFGELNPESVIIYSDEPRKVQIVSDEGTKIVGGRECKEAEDLHQRSFHSAWVSF